MSEPVSAAVCAPKERIQIIDALRGLSIILMVAYHTGYNLVMFKLAPEEALYNPLLSVLQPLFAGVFILLSGVSARYARNNRMRGLRVLGCAMVVSFVSGIFGVLIYFGILHCLGLCMILCGDPERTLDRVLPRLIQPFLLVPLFVIGRIFLYFESEIVAPIPYVYIFGLYPPDFGSADYFPILPWFFLYLLGAWVGLYIKERRFPRWFYAFRMPFLPVVGRHTLLIYMLHQPVVYFVVMGLSALLS